MGVGWSWSWCSCKDVVMLLILGAQAFKIILEPFWLPAACGGAALEANITVVLLMSFTQNLVSSLFSIIIYSALALLIITLLSISIA